MKKLNKVLKHLDDTKHQGLSFVKLDTDSARILSMTYASFANAPGVKSQVGYIIVLLEKNDRCYIFHYGSNRCQIVCPSVSTAEMHALLLGFDYAYVLQDMLQELLGRDFSVYVMTYSKTLLNFVTNDALMSERRLQINILQVRQSCDEAEIRRMAWFPGAKNPADPLT